MTKEQWIVMWEAIKTIEYNKIKCLPPRTEDITKIKNLIQSEIGQLE